MSYENKFVIDIGGPRDRRSLPLATKLGTHIPNLQKPEQLVEEIRRASIDMFRHRTEIQLRSWSKTYNCMGLVFASRRTHVGIESLRMILREDGYRQLPGPDAAALGDVVVYTIDEEPEHVGFVAEIRVDLGQGLRELVVLSKWGEDGEYLHGLRDVPDIHGRPTEYWTERR